MAHIVTWPLFSSRLVLPAVPVLRAAGKGELNVPQPIKSYMEFGLVRLGLGPDPSTTREYDSDKAPVKFNLEHLVPISGWSGPDAAVGL